MKKEDVVGKGRMAEGEKMGKEDAVSERRKDGIRSD
jgi:hypothetical protein